MKACMIAGDNSHYVHSLVQALSKAGLRIDLIGGDINEQYSYSPLVTFLNLRGSRDPNVSLIEKIFRILKYYFKCIFHIMKSDIRILHIQAFRFNFIEGAILLILYRLLGKKIIYTAHNIQPKGKNNIYNYLIFYIIYRCVNHIICHTEKIKKDLISKYGIREDKVSVIPHGMNYSVPITNISCSESRIRLDINPHARVMLLFGSIRPYKGYEIAIEALKHLKTCNEKMLLLVVGSALRKDEVYLRMLKDYVRKEGLEEFVRFYTRFIADGEIEIFFKASDVLILPYTESGFQSGVLFLSYRFGLPVIASDVGSFREEIENGVRGYVFHSGDSTDLAKKIQEFNQGLYLQANIRQCIKQYTMEKYSWENIACMTLETYKRVLQNARS